MENKKYLLVGGEPMEGEYSQEVDSKEEALTLIATREYGTDYNVRLYTYSDVELLKE